jgi:SAM-dependent methyltransferase
VTSAYFDQWFSDIAASDARQDLFTTHLGVPPEVGPSNGVPLDGLREIAATVAPGLTDAGVLVDLACGRGGPGMWIARETGCDLVGVDFAAEAIAQATERRALFGLTERATFVVGDLEDTGLSAGTFDAAVCIDAFQFATDAAAAAAEIRRILRPGGRVVLTSWEAVDRGDEAVSERLRKVDLSGALDEAGFLDVSTSERPSWHELNLQLWQAAVEIDPGDDPAMKSTVEEAHRSIDNHDKLRRVFATASAP